MLRVSVSARRPQHVLTPYFGFREMLHVYMGQPILAPYFAFWGMLPSCSANPMRPYSETGFRVPDIDNIPPPFQVFEFALGNVVPSHRFWYYHRVNMEGTPFTSRRVLDMPLGLHRVLT
ncbi:hypothetical protein M413DRAFT_283328 [Hebeloma cylindrosporum]|uniref:Uncharacterized protein n=1 Tax=Hebeloma cylindrosporum TaxID=76867 RepID=A0A0C3BJ52_HEBCY|nr:hypothetical protein M413DRAFT_283328 [Hebeloma cylindrosporum h7]